MNGIHHLRVLIANQRSDRLEVLAQVVTGLGHEVIAREIHVSDVAAVTAGSAPTSRWSGSARTPRTHWSRSRRSSPRRSAP